MDETHKEVIEHIEDILDNVDLMKSFAEARDPNGRELYRNYRRRIRALIRDAERKIDLI